MAHSKLTLCHVAALLCSMLLYIPHLHASASPPDGTPCDGDDQEQTRKTEHPVSVTGLTDAGTSLVNKLKDTAKSNIANVRIDTDYVKKWVKDHIPKVVPAWGQDKIDQAIADTIKAAGDSINAKKDEVTTKLADDAGTKLTNAIKALTPQAVLTATNDWKTGCCDKGSWSDPNADLSAGENGDSNSGVEVSGSAEFEITIGAAAGIEESQKLTLSISLNASIKINGFTRKRCFPKTGGSSTVYATPTYETKVGAKGGVGIGLKIEIGADITGAGTLTEITGGVSCKDQ